MFQQVNQITLLVKENNVNIYGPLAFVACLLLFIV